MVCHPWSDETVNFSGTQNKTVNVAAYLAPLHFFGIPALALRAELYPSGLNWATTASRQEAVLDRF